MENKDHCAELDKEGKVIFVNEPWKKFARENGYAGTSLGVGTNYLDICDKARGKDAEGADQAMLGLKTILNQEFTSYLQDYPCHSPTEQRWFKMIAVPSKLGNEFGALTIHRNITDDISYLHEVTSNIERLEDFLELSTHWYWEIDENQIIKEICCRTEQYLPKDQEDIIGYPLAEILFEDSDLEDRSRLEEILKSSESFANLEFRYTNRLGGIRYCTTAGKPMIGWGGMVTGYRGVVVDITDRKAMEERLREDQKMEVLGQVTQGVAHEFNNLLQAIVGSLDLVGDKLAESDPLTPLMEIARRSAAEGKELTGNLLSYVGKRPLQSEITDVGGFVLKVVDPLKLKLGKTVEIEARVADDLWPIRVDQVQLQRVFLNLATNSRDAMPDGGRLVIVAVNAHIDEGFAAERPYDVTSGDYVKLAVTDTGTGMSSEVREKACDPFFTTKEVGRGTGMGLSIVYGFVRRQSGGFIDIDSEEGRGTTVTIYLPRAQVEGADTS